MSTSPWLQQLETTIRQHLTDPTFNVDRLAQFMQMSRTTLYRRVARESGLPANRYIMRVRLCVAREMLESRSIRNLGELARAVGYADPDHLSRLYRQHFNISPVRFFAKPSMPEMPSD